MIGDFIRTAVQEEIRQMGGVTKPVVTSTRPLLRRGSTGDAVRDLQGLLQNALGDELSIDGQFGPATYAALVFYRLETELVPDGFAGRMTWASLAGSQ